ncbi:MAG: N-methyl-D-aspartate receptor NMDAR2C subunit [Myxococcota bacterium]
MDPTGLSAFTAHWTGLGADPGAAAAAHADVLARWGEPHRAYHDRAHLAACLAAFGSVRALTTDPDAVAIALWYHDAVYDPRGHDNEGESAALARRHLGPAGARPDAVARVVGLIDATRHAAVPADDDARLLVDIDLGVLGAPPDRYARYEEEIRREYAWVPADVFRAKRAEILRGFLARPRIYATAAFADREAAARANLAWAIARLGG